MASLFPPSQSSQVFSNIIIMRVDNFSIVVLSCLNYIIGIYQKKLQPHTLRIRIMIPVLSVIFILRRSRHQLSISFEEVTGISVVFVVVEKDIDEVHID